MTPTIYDPCIASLGEGPVWEPLSQALWWVDIDHARLSMHCEDGNSRDWTLPRAASAVFRGGSGTEVLLATGRGLERFDMAVETLTALATLPDVALNLRSNDSRADAWGGVWISQMDRGAAAGKGAIWRLMHGKSQRVAAGLTVPNGIAFDASCGLAFFADSARHQVFRLALDRSTGWPEGAPELWLDLSAEGRVPDGAVVDADGLYWSAHWGAGVVAAYAPDGTEARRLTVPATQPTCPAFGGAGFTDLFVTTAATGLGERAQAADGAVLRFSGVVRGQPEPEVVL